MVRASVFSFSMYPPAREFSFEMTSSNGSLFIEVIVEIVQFGAQKSRRDNSPTLLKSKVRAWAAADKVALDQKFDWDQKAEAYSLFTLQTSPEVCASSAWHNANGHRPPPRRSAGGRFTYSSRWLPSQQHASTHQSGILQKHISCLLICVGHSTSLLACNQHSGPILLALRGAPLTCN